jgi:hypothetical protein
VHPNHLKACESVDASVFNGEILFTGLEEFKVYLERWNKAVLWHETVCTGCNGTGLVGGLTPNGYETEDCPFYSVSDTKEQV